MILYIFIFGLIIGSFLGALTYRLPKGISILKGRSFCPSCKKKISWHDNIPLLSFLLLKGKCRNCGKKISPREPIIEISTAFLFVLVYYLKILPDFNIYSSFVYLLVTSVMIAIFVTDLESQIIPDSLSLFLILLAFVQIILVNDDKLFAFLVAGFGASLFLLFLNLITKGRGMGLGDVKLAIFGGTFLGYPNVVSWLFLSFVIGAIIGVTFVLIGKAHFGKRIAFAPFLVFSFFLVFFWGDVIKSVILPYL